MPKPNQNSALNKDLKGEIVALDAEDNQVEDTEDGGAIIQLAEKATVASNTAHFANIVESIAQAELSSIAVELLELLERDKEAREKRDKQYEEGLRRTGLGDDAPGGAQFSGANKVVHPMLVEACVDFSARVMKEIFPPSGPVKAKILGIQSQAKVAKAQRKVDYMNWQATEQMPEFRGELEQLSTQLPLGGGQYLKVMWMHSRQRPTVEFVAIDDILLPFAATNFYSAERKTHAQYITAAEYRKRVKAGMYIDVDLSLPEDPEYSRAVLANNKIEGRTPSSYNEDGLRTVFEVYTSLELDDGEVCPYIITIDKSTQNVLSIYRNWDKLDTSQTPLEWIVEFAFVPWRGAYPIGLTHLIGGLSGAATGALRALLDSAHIQNIPSMLKLKGGPNGQTITVQPTEIVEIEGGAMIDDIRKLAMPIPFNPPSATLFQLLGFLVDAGKGVVQTSFEKLSEQNQSMPVGTTMALIEQGMVVFSSIHARMHNSMSRLFKILHRLNGAYLTAEDLKAQVSGLELEPADFDGLMDVVPVSDPQIFSETQRFAQMQAVMQRAATVPGMYDQRKIEEMFIRSMKLPTDILTPKPGEDDIDPVSENVAVAMGRPAYVLPKQDHLAHLKCHMAFLRSPLFGANPVIAKTYLYPIVNHLKDHLLNYYLVECQRGVQLATENGVIEAESDQEIMIVAQVQQMIEQALSGLGQMLPDLDKQAQQFAPKPPPMPQDMSLQVAQANAQAKQALAAQRQQFEAQQLQITQATVQQREQTEQVRAQQQTELAKFKLQLAQQGTQQQFELNMQVLQDKVALEEFKQDQENQRKQAELDTRERMNSSDNDTAMRLAAAEIATGERVAVSTGTGINPNP